MQLFSEEIGQTSKVDDEIETEALLEQCRQPPLNLDQQAADGKIIRKDSSVEWQGKRGNIDITICAKNTEPHCQWQAEWEKNHSKWFGGQESDSKKKRRFEEKKSLDPSVSFSLRWSSDD